MISNVCIFGLGIDWQGIYVNELAFLLGGVKCFSKAGEHPPERSVLRLRACVFCYIFPSVPSEKMSTRQGGAAWLTSCALVFHPPNQRLPFTEVSVPPELLSHFDLTVALEGAWPRATAESHLLVSQNGRTSMLKKKEVGIPWDFLSYSKRLLCLDKCIRCLSPLAALSHRAASIRDLWSCWSE